MHEVPSTGTDARWTPAGIRVDCFNVDFGENAIIVVDGIGFR